MVKIKMFRKNNLRYLFIILYIIVLILSISGCINKQELIPMRAYQGKIGDGEFLKYSILDNDGNHYQYNMVTHINGKTADVFMNILKDGSKLKIPDNYSNYQSHMIVSLENGSLLNYSEDKRTNAVLENSDDPAMTEISINQDDGEAVCVEQIWDGYKFNTQKSRIKIVKDYPVWNWNFVMFVGLRYLDVTRSGDIYFVVPQYIKNTFHGSFIIKGKEMVETKAGKFNTLRLSFVMGDRFLARLTESYIKEFVFWVDVESGVLVREKSIDSTAELVEAGVLKK